MELTAPDVRKNLLNNLLGFTLVELMITLVVSAIIIAALYSVYTVQQRTYSAQDAVSVMQQNLRAALMLMSSEIRMAGLDEMETSGAGITSAKIGELGFTLDINGNGSLGDTNEQVVYGFSESYDSNPRDGVVDDLNGDGKVNDVAPLGRDTGGGFLPIADNIQALEFNYILNDGSMTTSPATNLYDNIRSVQISILARADRPSKKFTDTKTYTTASGSELGPFDDEYRRRLLVTTIQLRNMGM